MDLFEYEGKRLLRFHGVSVPRGALWGETDHYPLPAVIKAQVLTGGRGKAGGVLFVDDRESLYETATRLLSRTISAHKVNRLYVEERIIAERECYISLTLDRDLGAVTLVASPYGGVNVEESSEQRAPLTLTIDPLLGPRAYHARIVAAELGLLAGTSHKSVTELLEYLWNAFVKEDATLIEINPLAVTESHNLIALDAKISLDSNGLIRHTYSPYTHATLQGTLEANLSKVGVSYTDIDPDGNIIAAVSGAGLMMATLDMLRDEGVSVRGTVDLGGTVLAQDSRTQQVFIALFQARPHLIFVNGFLHTASCKRLCDALCESAAEWDRERTKIVVRIKGQDSHSGRRALEELGMITYSDLAPALSRVVEEARDREVVNGNPC